MEFRNLLQQADYSLILPKQGIEPFDLILRKEKNIFSWFKETQGSWIGSKLMDILVMKKRSEIPEIEEVSLPKNLIGSDVLKGDSYFTANVSLKIDAEANALLKKAKTVLFSFANAKELAVNQVQLDEYMQFAELNKKTPKFAKEVEKGNMYVVLNALLSNKLTLKNANDFQAQANLEAKTVEEYAKVLAGADVNSSENYYIANAGKEFLTFAIKTAKIIYKGGKFCLSETQINVRSSDNQSIELLSDCEEIIFE